MESKKEIYDILPKGTYPETILIRQPDSHEKVKLLVKQRNLSFPIMAKPDIGMKGLGTQILHHDEDLENYHRGTPVDYLLQEFVNMPEEIGIFYVRKPNSLSGEITGLVSKEFVTVIGDGICSVKELVNRDPRLCMQWASIQSHLQNEADRIPLQGEKVMILPYGNHARGSKFTDSSYRITPKLNGTIDKLCQQITGFTFGRLDIRYQDFERLEAGQSFSIIELNGSGSEPTHIYDPRHSLWFAWKEITRHVKLLFEISQHSKLLGTKPLSFREGLNMMVEHRKHLKKLKMIPA